MYTHVQGTMTRVYSQDGSLRGQPTIERLVEHCSVHVQLLIALITKAHTYLLYTRTRTRVCSTVIHVYMYSMVVDREQITVAVYGYSMVVGT